METRRTFLKSGAALAAAAGAGIIGPEFAPGSPAQDKASPAGVPPSLVDSRRSAPRFKLGCAAYSYRQHLEKGKSMTLEGFIDKCAEMRLDGTELTSYYFPRTDREYLISLKRRAFLLGLDISGTAVGNDFCRVSGPERDKDIAHVKTWVEHAALLGAGSIRIFAGNVPKGDTDEAARARAVAAIRECCEHAARHGVFLALENHGGITATADQLLAICRGVDSPWFGVNLDTGNFHTEDPYADLEKVAPHAVTVQVKVEVTPKSGKRQEADLKRVIDMLRAVNYRGNVVLEYEAAEEPLTAVPKWIEKLRGLL